MLTISPFLRSPPVLNSAVPFAGPALGAPRTPQQITCRIEHPPSPSSNSAPKLLYKVSLQLSTQSLFSVGVTACPGVVGIAVFSAAITSFHSRGGKDDFGCTNSCRGFGQNLFCGRQTLLLRSGLVLCFCRLTTGSQPLPSPGCSYREPGGG